MGFAKTYYSVQDNMLFDPKTVLAYNALIQAAFSHAIWIKALTLFHGLVLMSEDGGMRDDPPGRFYPAWLSG